jgi:proteasome activator subunit 4
MFIVSAVQHIKVGDLSMHQSGLPLSEDAPGESLMDIDSDYPGLPDGTDIGDIPRLTKDEERLLVRESTAGFAGE